MPYTPNEQRRLPIKDQAPNVGNLTYWLQQVIHGYLTIKMDGDPEQLLRYQYLAEVTGALEQCKLDFQRRVVEPYETRKCEENGDVWEPFLRTAPPEIVKP